MLIYNMNEPFFLSVMENNADNQTKIIFKERVMGGNQLLFLMNYRRYKQ